MHEVESYEHNGIQVQICLDPEPLNPRTEWDHAATMVCWHRRSNLGDEQASLEYGSIEELIRETVPKGAFVQPLWLYEHGGMTMSTTSGDGNPFSCPWDSGQVGFIYMSRDKVRETMMRPRNYPIAKLAEDAAKIMNGEVEEYDAYLRGECYGFIVDDDESCWGFLGEIEYCKQEANSVAEYIATDKAEKAAKAEAERQARLEVAFSFAL